MFACTFLACALLVAGCKPSVSPTAPLPRSSEQLTQVSIINALMLGQYDGVMPLKLLLKYGDFGLGGHVIDCQIKTGQVAFDACDSWLIKLSESEAFQREQLGRDMSKELEAVERSRGMK